MFNNKRLLIYESWIIIDDIYKLKLLTWMLIELNKDRIICNIELCIWKMSHPSKSSSKKTSSGRGNWWEKRKWVFNVTSNSWTFKLSTHSSANSQITVPAWIYEPTKPPKPAKVSRNTWLNNRKSMTSAIQLEMPASRQNQQE